MQRRNQGPFLAAAGEAFPEYFSRQKDPDPPFREAAQGGTFSGAGAGPGYRERPLDGPALPLEVELGHAVGDGGFDGGGFLGEDVFLEAGLGPVEGSLDG